MVMHMSRVERKKQERLQEKLNERKARKKLLWVIALVFFLVGGIVIVDESTRTMMMFEEPRAFGHKKIDESIHEFYICGEKVLIDEKEIRSGYEQVKSEVEVFLKVLKDKKDQFVKTDE
ncbi:hypothetical protein AN619_13180 [Thermotalea metallivorans]|uniref:Uncharacterized protein n=2 Tax=Thermotalea metallivorans TaxID=520762 RepID=A0A140L5N0_9FIRM|nr:hypothetical protein AN619_13180 [Thermotalea metallivorans]